MEVFQTYTFPPDWPYSSKDKVKNEMCIFARVTLRNIEKGLENIEELQSKKNDIMSSELGAAEHASKRNAQIILEHTRGIKDLTFAMRHFKVALDEGLFTIAELNVPPLSEAFAAIYTATRQLIHPNTASTTGIQLGNIVAPPNLTIIEVDNLGEILSQSCNLLMTGMVDSAATAITETPLGFAESVSSYPSVLRRSIETQAKHNLANGIASNKLGVIIAATLNPTPEELQTECQRINTMIKEEVVVEKFSDPHYITAFQTTAASTFTYFESFCDFALNLRNVDVYEFDMSHPGFFLKISSIAHKISKTYSLTGQSTLPNPLAPPVRFGAAVVGSLAHRLTQLVAGNVNPQAHEKEALCRLEHCADLVKDVGMELGVIANNSPQVSPHFQTFIRRSSSSDFRNAEIENRVLQNQITNPPIPRTFNPRGKIMADSVAASLLGNNIPQAPFSMRCNIPANLNDTCADIWGRFNPITSDNIIIMKNNIRATRAQILVSSEEVSEVNRKNLPSSVTETIAVMARGSKEIESDTKYLSPSERYLALEYVVGNTIYHIRQIPPLLPLASPAENRFFTTPPVLELEVMLLSLQQHTPIPPNGVNVILSTGAKQMKLIDFVDDLEGILLLILELRSANAQLMHQVMMLMSELEPLVKMLKQQLKIEDAFISKQSHELSNFTTSVFKAGAGVVMPTAQIAGVASVLDHAGVAVPHVAMAGGTLSTQALNTGDVNQMGQNLLVKELFTGEGLSDSTSARPEMVAGMMFHIASSMTRGASIIENTAVPETYAVPVQGSLTDQIKTFGGYNAWWVVACGVGGVVAQYINNPAPMIIKPANLNLASLTASAQAADAHFNAMVAGVEIGKMRLNGFNQICITPECYSGLYCEFAYICAYAEREIANHPAWNQPLRRNAAGGAITGIELVKILLKEGCNFGGLYGHWIQSNQEVIAAGGVATPGGRIIANKILYNFLNNVDINNMSGYIAGAEGTISLIGPAEISTVPGGFFARLNTCATSMQELACNFLLNNPTDLALTSYAENQTSILQNLLAKLANGTYFLKNPANPGAPPWLNAVGLIVAPTMQHVSEFLEHVAAPSTISAIDEIVECCDGLEMEIKTAELEVRKLIPMPLSEKQAEITINQRWEEFHKVKNGMESGAAASMIYSIQLALAVPSTDAKVLGGLLGAAIKLSQYFPNLTKHTLLTASVEALQLRYEMKTQPSKMQSPMGIDLKEVLNILQNIGGSAAMELYKSIIASAVTGSDGGLVFSTSIPNGTISLLMKVFSHTKKDDEKWKDLIKKLKKAKMLAKLEAALKMVGINIPKLAFNREQTYKAVQEMADDKPKKYEDHDLAELFKKTFKILQDEFANHFTPLGIPIDQYNNKITEYLNLNIQATTPENIKNEIAAKLKELISHNSSSRPPDITLKKPNNVDQDLIEYLLKMADFLLLMQKYHKYILPARVTLVNNMIQNVQNLISDLLASQTLHGELSISSLERQKLRHFVKTLIGSKIYSPKDLEQKFNNNTALLSVLAGACNKQAEKKILEAQSKYARLLNMAHAAEIAANNTTNGVGVATNLVVAAYNNSRTNNYQVVGVGAAAALMESYLIEHGIYLPLLHAALLPGGSIDAANNSVNANIAVVAGGAPLYSAVHPPANNSLDFLSNMINNLDQNLNIAQASCNTVSAARLAGGHTDNAIDAVNGKPGGGAPDSLSIRQLIRNVKNIANQRVVPPVNAATELDILLNRIHLLNASIADVEIEINLARAQVQNSLNYVNVNLGTQAVPAAVGPPAVAAVPATGLYLDLHNITTDIVNWNGLNPGIAAPQAITDVQTAITDSIAALVQARVVLTTAQTFIADETVTLQHLQAAANLAKNSYNTLLTQVMEHQTSRELLAEAQVAQADLTTTRANWAAPVVGGPGAAPVVGGGEYIAFEKQAIEEFSAELGCVFANNDMDGVSSLGVAITGVNPPSATSSPITSYVGNNAVISATNVFSTLLALGMTVPANIDANNQIIGIQQPPAFWLGTQSEWNAFQSAWIAIFTDILSINPGWNAGFPNPLTPDNTLQIFNILQAHPNISGIMSQTNTFFQLANQFVAAAAPAAVPAPAVPGHLTPQQQHTALIAIIPPALPPAPVLAVAVPPVLPALPVLPAAPAPAVVTHLRSDSFQAAASNANIASAKITFKKKELGALSKQDKSNVNKTTDIHSLETTNDLNITIAKNRAKENILCNLDLIEKVPAKDMPEAKKALYNPNLNDTNSLNSLVYLDKLLKNCNEKPSLPKVVQLIASMRLKYGEDKISAIKNASGYDPNDNTTHTPFVQALHDLHKREGAKLEKLLDEANSISGCVQQVRKPKPGVQKLFKLMDYYLSELPATTKDILQGRWDTVFSGEDESSWIPTSTRELEKRVVDEAAVVGVTKAPDNATLVGWGVSYSDNLKDLSRSLEYYFSFEIAYKKLREANAAQAAAQAAQAAAQAAALGAGDAEQKALTEANAALAAANVAQAAAQTAFNLVQAGVAGVAGVAAVPANTNPAPACARLLLEQYLYERAIMLREIMLSLLRMEALLQCYKDVVVVSIITKIHELIVLNPPSFKEPYGGVGMSPDGMYELLDKVEGIRLSTSNFVNTKMGGTQPLSQHSAVLTNTNQLRDTVGSNYYAEEVSASELNHSQATVNFATALNLVLSTILLGIASNKVHQDEKFSRSGGFGTAIVSFFLSVIQAIFRAKAIVNKRKFNKMLTVQTWTSAAGKVENCLWSIQISCALENNLRVKIQLHDGEIELPKSEGDLFSMLKDAMNNQRFSVKFISALRMNTNPITAAMRLAVHNKIIQERAAQWNAFQHEIAFLYTAMTAAFVINVAVYNAIQNIIDNGQYSQDVIHALMRLRSPATTTDLHVALTTVTTSGRTVLEELALQAGATMLLVLFSEIAKNTNIEKDFYSHKKQIESCVKEFKVIAQMEGVMQVVNLSDVEITAELEKPTSCSGLVKIESANKLDYKHLNDLQELIIMCATSRNMLADWSKIYGDKCLGRAHLSWIFNLLTQIHTALPEHLQNLINLTDIETLLSLSPKVQAKIINSLYKDLTVVSTFLGQQFALLSNESKFSENFAAAAVTTALTSGVAFMMVDYENGGSSTEYGTTEWEMELSCDKSLNLEQFQILRSIVQDGVSYQQRLNSGTLSEEDAKALGASQEEIDAARVDSNDPSSPISLAKLKANGVMISRDEFPGSDEEFAELSPNGEEIPIESVASGYNPYINDEVLKNSSLSAELKTELMGASAENRIQIAAATLTGVPNVNPKDGETLNALENMLNSTKNEQDSKQLEEFREKFLNQVIENQIESTDNEEEKAKLQALLDNEELTETKRLEEYKKILVGAEIADCKEEWEEYLEEASTADPNKSKEEILAEFEAAKTEKLIADLEEAGMSAEDAKIAAGRVFDSFSSEDTKLSFDGQEIEEYVKNDPELQEKWEYYNSLESPTDKEKLDFMEAIGENQEAKAALEAKVNSIKEKLASISGDDDITQEEINAVLTPEELAMTETLLRGKIEGGVSRGELEAMLEEAKSHPHMAGALTLNGDSGESILLPETPPDALDDAAAAYAADPSAENLSRLQQAVNDKQEKCGGSLPPGDQTIVWGVVNPDNSKLIDPDSPEGILITDMGGDRFQEELVSIDLGDGVQQQIILVYTTPYATPDTTGMLSVSDIGEDTNSNPDVELGDLESLGVTNQKIVTGETFVIDDEHDTSLIGVAVTAGTTEILTAGAMTAKGLLKDSKPQTALESKQKARANAGQSTTRVSRNFLPRKDDVITQEVPDQITRGIYSDKQGWQKPIYGPAGALTTTEQQRNAELEKKESFQTQAYLTRKSKITDASSIRLTKKVRT